MDHVCFALPVLAGQTDRARAFMRQLDTNRREEFDRSERRIGISKELWFLAVLPSGDHLVGYMEAADFNRGFGAFVGSRDAFDLWFKAEMLAVTGLDLNNPPPDTRPAELLSHYETASLSV